MKKTYKSHFRKFTIIAILVTLIVVFWQINILINQYKINAESENDTPQEQESGKTNNPYSVANEHQNNSNTNQQSNFNSENDASNNGTNDNIPPANTNEKTPEEETDVVVMPQYIVSTNLENCINDFIEFDLMKRSGFEDLDDTTITTTYKGLCDELIYSKPTNSYEFIYERPPQLPEMPYYVESAGIFLLDNYEVRYE